MSKASVPQGASPCSTPGTGNRKHQASSGQLLLPLDPAACDHRTISPLSPSRSPGRSQALIGQDPGPEAPPLSYQLQPLSEIFKLRSTFGGGGSRFYQWGPRVPPLSFSTRGVARGVTRGHAPASSQKRVREGGRRKRKLGKEAVGQASVGAVVLAPGLFLSVFPVPVCRRREALFRRRSVPSRVVFRIGI